MLQNPTDQIWYKHWRWCPKSIINAYCKRALTWNLPVADMTLVVAAVVAVLAVLHALEVATSDSAAPLLAETTHKTSAATCSADDRGGRTCVSGTRLNREDFNPWNTMQIPLEFVA